MAYKLLLVFLGGGLGSMARFGLSTWANQAFLNKIIFPYGTMAVNLMGSFLAGVILAISAETTLRPEARLFLMVGFLGGFTTFSAFAAESYNLIQDGQWKDALINVLANNLGAIVLVFAGVFLTGYVYSIIRGGV
ncbi:MAG: fluoride efflux transporter CrcB [Spirochaetia bacterium]|nr:fluoride efflux transporter CrcB [Spirochaetia bacterium]